MQIIALLSFLIFIPSLGYAQSLSEMDRQLDEETLEKIKHVSAIEKKSDFSKLDCPEGAYHGLENQGNDVCRDILTNQIVDPETEMITDSGNEMIIDSGNEVIIDSSRGRITDSSIGEIILNDDLTDYVKIGILGLIGIIATVIGLSRKKIVSAIAQRRGWSMIQNQQVRQTKYQLQHLQYSYIRKIEFLRRSLKWKIQLRRRKITQSIQGLNKLVPSPLR